MGSKRIHFHKQSEMWTQTTADFSTLCQAQRSGVSWGCGCLSLHGRDVTDEETNFVNWQCFSKVFLNPCVDILDECGLKSHRHSVLTFGLAAYVHWLLLILCIFRWSHWIPCTCMLRNLLICQLICSCSCSQSREPHPTLACERLSHLEMLHLYPIMTPSDLFLSHLFTCVISQKGVFKHFSMFPVLCCPSVFKTCCRHLQE